MILKIIHKPNAIADNTNDALGLMAYTSPANKEPKTIPKDLMALNKPTSSPLSPVYH